MHNTRVHTHTHKRKNTHTNTHTITHTQSHSHTHNNMQTQTNAHTNTHIQRLQILWAGGLREAIAEARKLAGIDEARTDEQVISPALPVLCM